MKGIFDITVSFIALIILSPFLLIIGLLIVLDSKGGIIYAQERVGLNFGLFKITEIQNYEA